MVLVATDDEVQDVDVTGFGEGRGAVVGESGHRWARPGESRLEFAAGAAVVVVVVLIVLVVLVAMEVFRVVLFLALGPATPCRQLPLRTSCFRAVTEPVAKLSLDRDDERDAEDDEEEDVADEEAADEAG